jgi:glycosyltransferase involved in cell wall biosynthesis
VTDAELRWLYANARGLVSMSREDFGLTPIEANAFGTPALLVRDGGFAETLDPGVSGAWVESRDPDEWRQALVEFPDFDATAVRAHARQFSPGAFVERIRAISTARTDVVDVSAVSALETARGSAS